MKKKRKYLMLSRDYFPPQVGGISRMMSDVCDALGPHNTAVLTAVRGADEARTALRVHRHPWAFSTHSLAREIALMTLLMWLLYVYRPVLLLTATTSDAIIAHRFKKLFGIPFIVFAHGNELLAALDASWQKPRLALKAAEAVVANSSYTADLVRRNLAGPERVRVIHPVCRNPERFRTETKKTDLRWRHLGMRSEAPVLLTVGNLVARKGHEPVLRMLPDLQASYPGLLYVIVGDGPHRTHLENVRNSLCLGDTVRFLGRVADQSLPDVYALADIFVMVSVEDRQSYDVEGFGIVYLEAAASSLPVVAGTHGGVADAVIDGETGFLVDPQNGYELVQKITYLLNNPGTMRTMGERGRDRVYREFSSSAMRSGINNLLSDHCLGETPPANEALRK